MPRVNVTDSTKTTLDASWVNDIVPDNFIVRISEELPFKENLEKYMEYMPSDDVSTFSVEGDCVCELLDNDVSNTASVCR